MNGVFYVYKPMGISSFGVVAQLKKKFNESKIGHTGTLDENAEGLLIVLMGKYTKFLPYCQHNHKKYVASLEFGKDTDSKDKWGQTISTRDISLFSDVDMCIALENMIGKQQQIPPMISSKKVNGKRLLEYAHKGETVEVKPKDIEVYDARLLSLNPLQVYFEVSGGTYVRVLCEDLAHALNNNGYMTSLIRIGIGNSSVVDSQLIEQLTENDCRDIKEVLDPDIPVIPMGEARDVYHGKPLNLHSEAPLVFIQVDNEIIAVYEKKGDHYVSKRGLW